MKNLKRSKSIFFLFLSLFGSMLFILGCKESVDGPTIPTISTTIISEITTRSAKGGGKITDDGGSFITERGICWGLNPNPIIDNNKTNDGIGSGEFVSSIGQLVSGTKYYVRAYAINSIGVSYGDELTFTTLSPPSNPVPKSGLVGWWPFNGDAIDESENENNGIVYGAILSKDRFGILNKAYSFDGVDDYIDLGDMSGVIDNLNILSISYWISSDFNFNDPSGNKAGGIFSHWDPKSGSTSSIGIQVGMNPVGGTSVSLIGGTGSSAIGTMPSSNYSHGVIIYDGTSAEGQRLKFYLNGNFIGPFDAPASSQLGSSGNKTVIGGSLGPYPPDNVYYHFKGNIDDIAIYNRVLTADEILKIYNGTGF